MPADPFEGGRPTMVDVSVEPSYDRLEGAGEDVVIGAVGLLHEKGGRSGSWTRTPDR